MSRQIDADECNCNCHSHPGTRHIAACCHECPYCGKRILVHFSKTHIDQCKIDNLDEKLIKDLNNLGEI